MGRLQEKPVSTEGRGDAERPTLHDLLQMACAGYAAEACIGALTELLGTAIACSAETPQQAERLVDKTGRHIKGVIRESWDAINGGNGRPPRDEASPGSAEQGLRDALRTCVVNLQEVAARAGRPKDIISEFSEVITAYETMREFGDVEKVQEVIVRTLAYCPNLANLRDGAPRPGLTNRDHEGLMRGALIRKARIRLKLRQDQLAELVGVSRQTMSGIEVTGRMRSSTLRKLEQVLELSLSHPLPPPEDLTGSEDLIGRSALAMKAGIGRGNRVIAAAWAAIEAQRQGGSAEGTVKVGSGTVRWCLRSSRGSGRQFIQVPASAVETFRTAAMLAEEGGRGT